MYNTTSTRARGRYCPSAAVHDTRRSDTSCCTSALCRRGQDDTLSVQDAGGLPSDASTSEDDNMQIVGHAAWWWPPSASSLAEPMRARLGPRPSVPASSIYACVLADRAYACVFTVSWRHGARRCLRRGAGISPLPPWRPGRARYESVACSFSLLSFIDYLYFCGAYPSHFWQSGKAIEDPHLA
jgi:hypothetical protein